MKIREILSKTVLTRTGISGFDYCLNPYVGCGHGCKYCYASFMKRFTGHREPWGQFVDVKVNAAQRLEEQLSRARRGVVALGTVTDPYQPLEKAYRITRGCLEALLKREFPVNLLTRSPLCLRDLDLFRKFKEIEVGLSITTDDERMRRIFEPASPPIPSRVKALEVLKHHGIKTYAFIGPILPMRPESLVEMLSGRVDAVLVDRMNYPDRVRRLYQSYGLETYLSNDYFYYIGTELRARFAKKGIEVTMIF